VINKFFFFLVISNHCTRQTDRQTQCHISRPIARRYSDAQ